MDAVVYFNQAHKNKAPSPEHFAYSVSEKGFPDIPYRYLNCFYLELNFGPKIIECSPLPESEARCEGESLIIPLVEAFLRYFRIQERMPGLYSNYF